MDRQKNIGCIWGVHLLLAILWLCYVAGALDRGNEILFLLSSVMATLEIAFVVGMRFFFGRRWVWLLGYVCWFSMFVIGLVLTFIMFIDVKDPVGVGMLIVLGLPFTLGIMIGAFVGVINWNKLQIEAK